MKDEIEGQADALRLASLWCQSKGTGWTVQGQLGKGGTAPVFELATPEGKRALKIYDAEFSSGEKGEIEQKRIDQQLSLKGHNCPYLVQVYEGGRFKDRLFLLMSRASGSELEKCLDRIPRERIRPILDQVAQAVRSATDRLFCTSGPDWT